MSEVFLLDNPSSGGADDEVLARVAETLRAVGPVTRLQLPFDRLDAELPGALRDHALLVCAGGDGTLNCAVNALGATANRVTWGLIPMGTGNDLARTLELPHDPLAAAIAIVTGEERRLDLGVARGGRTERLFVNACMGGFPVEVDEVVEQHDLKEKLGALAFWFGGLKAGMELERATVRIDGHIIDECIAVGVGNGRTCGGGMEVFPDADPADGELDLCAFSAGSMASALALAARLKVGFDSDTKGITTIRGGSLAIEADPPLPFNIDGELVDLTTPATFEIAGSLTFRF